MMTETDAPEDDLLQGKTLKIYWYLLTRGESGIREIQRALKISSPSTVAYQVNKLVDAGLVSKSAKTDKYAISEPVKTGILDLYIKIGRVMVPRMLFYISLFTIGMVLYILLVISRGAAVIYTEDVLFFFFSISGTVIFCYEAYRIWTMKPL